LFLIISIDCTCQVKAVIKETGKEVNLFQDGTWKYVMDEPLEIVKTDTLVANRSNESDKLVKSSKINYGVWMNRKKWSVERSKDGNEQEFTFRMLGQDAYGMIVGERIEIPMDNLVDLAIQNAEKAAPDTKIIRNESRRVNGNLVRFVQLEGTSNGIKFVYLNYYYSGKKGSIQFMTYTAKNLLKEYRNEMETLLNGFVINEASDVVVANLQTNFEKKVTINNNAALHYTKDIEETVPNKIAQFMTDNDFINPELSTEIYLSVEDKVYKLKFVKDESVLNYKETILGFNVLELKLNTNLKLDKEIVLEFTSDDLTNTFALPRGVDIVPESAKEIFKLKIFHVDKSHTILYNDAMPISEVKVIGEGVKRLKFDFPENVKINLIFVNNGPAYTMKFFVLKKYWNTQSVADKCKRVVKYFKDSGIRKKINIKFVDFLTYEEISI